MSLSVHNTGQTSAAEAERQFRRSSFCPRLGLGLRLADGWVSGGIARFSRPTPLKLLHCGKETALPAFRLGRSIGANRSGMAGWLCVWFANPLVANRREPERLEIGGTRLG